METKAPTGSVVTDCSALSQEFIGILAGIGNMVDVRTARESEIKANKYLRRELDARLQELRQLPSSRERSLAITKLQECEMWLGMDLKRLGTPAPYPTSRDPQSTTVEPTADGLKM